MPFRPGVSGNSAGRPTLETKAYKIRKQILSAAPDFVSAMIDAAKAGDTGAGRALLISVCAPLKAVELPVSLPLNPDADLVTQGRGILAALASGKIAPSQASQLLAAVAGLAKLIELAELESRIAALETKS